MSLQWKSELRLCLGPRHCEGSVWGAGLKPRQLGLAQASGGEGALARVLDDLGDQGIKLPQQARVCLQDESLYYATLPADGPWREVQARALAHFSDALGDEALVVGATLSPCGRRWLAVAAEIPRIEAISEVLAERGVGLRHVTAELFDDLSRIGTDMPTHGVVVMLRDEGAMLVAVRDGSIMDLAWERMDLQTDALLRDRVKAYAGRTGVSAPGAQPDVLLVTRMDEPVAHLSNLAKTEAWRHLSLVGPCSGGMTPASVS